MKDPTELGPHQIGEDPIISFYRGERPDSSGRYVEDIWVFSYEQLETVHDFIQWLFPLPVRSAYNPDAPLLTQKTISAFLGNESLRGKLIRSLELMLVFYGFELVRDAHGSLLILRSAEFAKRSRQWLSPNNHNHLRLSRIMESARLLGLEQYSRGLIVILEGIAHEYPNCVTARTVEFWKRAAGE